MKRVILIHGWQGEPGNHWKKWFRKELETRGVLVIEPNMPNESNRPEDWINRLSEVVGELDNETVLVGHSLGCPTIVGFLSKQTGNSTVLGAVLVAGFFSKLPRFEDLALWDFKYADVEKAKEHCKKFVSIVSSNDSAVPFEKSKELNDAIFGEMVLEEDKGHFCEDDGVLELQSVLDATLKIFG